MSSQKNPTRSRILKTTWQLLEDGGGNAIRMSDIAKSAKISRQALYLHFPNRAELLVATTLYLDEVYDIDGQLAQSRNATTGQARLKAWVQVWGDYIPKIYGVAKALMALQDNDAEAATAWKGRMQAVREGCAAAVNALHHDGDLRQEITPEAAVDQLWMLLSVRNWEQLCVTCGWPQADYIAAMQDMAAQTLIGESGRTSGTQQS